jgi:hypothetical protein
MTLEGQRMSETMRTIAERIVDKYFEVNASTLLVDDIAHALEDVHERVDLEARIEQLEAALRRIDKGGTAVLITAAIDECPINPKVLEQIVVEAAAALAPEQDK